MSNLNTTNADIRNYRLWSCVNIVSRYANLYEEFSRTTMPFSYQTHLPCNEVWPTLTQLPPLPPSLLRKNKWGCRWWLLLRDNSRPQKERTFFFLFSSRMYMDQGDHRRCFEMSIFPAAVSVTSQIAWVMTESEFPLKKRLTTVDLLGFQAKSHEERNRATECLFR